MQRAIHLISSLMLIVLTTASFANETPPEVHVLVPSETVQAGQTFTVRVYVDPRGYGISAAEIEIRFSREAMEIVEVSLADLLGKNAVIAVKKVYNYMGLLEYAASRVGPTTPPTPATDFLHITFQVKNDARPGIYFFNITDYSFIDEKFSEIIGVQLLNGSIIVETSSSTASKTTWISSEINNTLQITSISSNTETYSTFINFLKQNIQKMYEYLRNIIRWLEELLNRLISR